MRNTTALFASTTVLFAAMSGYLAWSLATERARFAIVTADRAPSVSTPQRQFSPPPSKAPRTFARDTDVAVHPQPVATIDKSLGTTRQVVLPSRVTDPSQRSADIAYRRLRLQKEYPDLAVVLNLQADEADQFFSLLAEQEAEYAEWASTKATDKLTQADRDREEQRRWQADQAEQAALLGEARMHDWSKYLNSLGARAEVRDLRIQLADSDYPLRRDQYEPLVNLLAAEQVRHNAEREELRRVQGDTADRPPEQAIKYMDRRMDLIEESLARRRRAAATVLDSEQLRRYEAMLELQRLESQVEYDSFVTFTANVAQEQARTAKQSR